MTEASRRVVLLRYRVKPQHAELNLQLVRAVFDELEVARPAGVRYSTFLLDDRLTFVNLVAIENEAGLSPLGELAAYRRIQEGKQERFDQAPVSTELHEIGAYRIFSDSPDSARDPGRVRRIQRPARVAHAPAAPRSARRFDLVPASPRARELRARRSLQLAIAQSEATYELARQTLIEFEEYLGAAKSLLRAGGYPVHL